MKNSNDLGEQINRVSAEEIADNARVLRELREQFTLFQKLLTRVPVDERGKILHVFYRELREVVRQFRLEVAHCIVAAEKSPEPPEESDEDYRRRIFAELDRELALATGNENLWT